MIWAVIREFRTQLVVNPREEVNTIYFSFDIECLNFRPGQVITDDDYGPYSEPWGPATFPAGALPEVGIGLVLGAARFGLSEIWRVVRVLEHSCKVECVLVREFEWYGAYE